MKLLGAVLILAGSSLTAMYRLAEGRRERQALRELAAALELLAHGVRTSLLPLPRLMERRGGGTFADGFFAHILTAWGEGASLGERWRAAAEMLPLRARERETLARAADAFGESEEGITAVLLDCARSLRESEAVRRDEAAASQRLTLTLALGGGVLLTVMLL